MKKSEVRSQKKTILKRYFSICIDLIQTQESFCLKEITEHYLISERSFRRYLDKNLGMSFVEFKQTFIQKK